MVLKIEGNSSEYNANLDDLFGNLFGNDSKSLKTSKGKSSTGNNPVAYVTQVDLDILKKDIEKKLSIIEESFNNDTKKLFEETKRDIQLERNNIIGSLSLFVAFFTFISINVTIFSKVDDLFTALVLMFGMLICISMMLLLFFGILNNNKKKDAYVKENNEKNKILAKLEKSVDNIYINLFLILFIGMLLTLFFLKDSKTLLSPSLKDNIEKVENQIKNFDEKIKNLETENNKLKQDLENQISDKIELQILKQQSKTTTN